MTFNYPEGSPEKTLMEWFEKQEKEHFCICYILETDDINLNTRQRRQAVWQLIDNRDLYITDNLSLVLWKKYCDRMTKKEE
jgi:hypothetical protein